VAGANKSTAYNTFNFHDIAFQMPITRKLGLGFSLTPYSSVGYRTKYYHDYDPSDPVWGNVGRVQYNYQGEGDVSEVKLGLGWEVFKNFSIGVAAQYYWGSIDRDFIMTPTSITGEGTFASTVGLDSYTISTVKGQVGVQWSPILNQKRILTTLHEPTHVVAVGRELHADLDRTRIGVGHLVGGGIARAVVARSGHLAASIAAAPVLVDIIDTHRPLGPSGSGLSVSST